MILTAMKIFPSVLPILALVAALHVSCTPAADKQQQQAQQAQQAARQLEQKSQQPAKKQDAKTDGKTEVKKPASAVSATALPKDFDFKPISTTGVVVAHKGYTLSYAEEYEQPEWVAYEMNTRKLVRAAERSDKFMPDPNIPTGSAQLDDYRGSGYDRGHLVPAADMAYSEQTMAESFYLSNMTPQLHAFNGGIWRVLEEQVRDWTKKYKSLYVVAGPVLKPGLKRIGVSSRSDKNDKKVAVPEYNYKIILTNTDKPQAIAFLMPNKKGEKEVYEYVVSIDELEKMTGIDFFPALPDSLEDRLEASSSIDGWMFSAQQRASR